MICNNQLECINKTINYKTLFISKYFDKRYEYRQCSRCGLIYHSPESTQTELHKHYTDYGKYSDREEKRGAGSKT